ncbi:MAG TPA: hypothetical protein VFF82_02835 [Rhodocyclaceae bacterium]|nr:hypothetical protein [Rhodocyclaceae bacterium]
MRLLSIAISILCALIVTPVANAAATRVPDDSRNSSLHIQIEGGGWGSVSTEQIETVLQSVANELLAQVPNRFSATIIVTHTDSNPIALYDRGPAGEYLVRLHASDERWHLYVFEFAHEFCHLLSNYDENVSDDVRRKNQWFEETLCETASLYALERLASTWERSPSHAGLAEHAGKLGRFFNLLISEEHRHLPPQVQPAGWVSDNEDNLRRDPYQREKNDLVAKLLLPLFERSPKSWGALPYMNLDREDASASLTEYLQRWHQRVPLEHKAFVADVMTLLGVGAASPVTATLNPEAAGQQVLMVAGQSSPTER